MLHELIEFCRKLTKLGGCEEKFQSRTVYCAVEYQRILKQLGSLLAKFCKTGCTSTSDIFKLLQTRTAFRRFRGRKNFSAVDP
jgi:hypothetical protein